MEGVVIDSESSFIGNIGKKAEPRAVVPPKGVDISKEPMSWDKIHSRMGVFKYVSPTYWIDTVYNVVLELSNMFYFGRKIKHASENGVLSRLKMNNSSNEMYYVVNMPAETLMLPEKDMQQTEKFVLSNELLKVENHMADIGLYGLFKFKVERLQNTDYYAYLVSVIFNAKYINRGNLIYIFAYIICLVSLFGVLCI
jgi:hypothetical protein